jgi:crotonobetaine/carnitine-CoA ligase
VNLWEFLEQRVAQTPEKTLLHYKDVQQSFAEFHQTALKAASALRSLGVRTGDTVCLMLRNSPDYLYAWFALARLGAVNVPLNVHLKGEALAYIMEHAEARVVIVEDDLLPRIQELQAALPGLPRIVIRSTSAVPVPYLRWSDLLAEAASSCPGASVRSESVSAILYTSGTTGPPKGVMLSHQAYLNSARFFAEQMVGATRDDTLYTCLPLFHINAQAHTVLPAIYQNATIALGEAFSASGFWHEIRRYEVTIFNLLAAMIPILCKQSPSPGDRNHHARLTACAATPKDVWRQFEERFGVRIIEGYGLTETTGFCVTNPREAVRIGSIGKPMDFVEVQVVDEQDQEVPPNQLGEITVRPKAPHVFMEGYYKMPEQTAQVMRGGAFHTGDMGYADADGYLYFVDRIKQSIRRRGENISSWEVEKVINAHPKVLECAAVGVPSELGEEEVKVYIVCRPGETLEPLDIIQWCEERMAYFMVPRYIEFRSALPKTATERVEKYKLKQEGIGAAWDREAAGYKLKRT